MFPSQQIIREISKKVSSIQNAGILIFFTTVSFLNFYFYNLGLGEHRIRDLNDEINKLLREKFHWEERIRELGGADYRKSNTKIVDSQGLELPGSGGYKYFGAAKDLPGVRELFQKEVPPAPTKNRVDLYKIITYDYYGQAEKENHAMLEEERNWEEKYKNDELKKWIEGNVHLIKKKFKGRNLDDIEEHEFLKIINENEKIEVQIEEEEVKEKGIITEIVESKKDDQLSKRKNEVLKKYFNEMIGSEEEEAKIIKEMIENNE